MMHGTTNIKFTHPVFKVTVSSYFSKVPDHLLHLLRNYKALYLSSFHFLRFPIFTICPNEVYFDWIRLDLAHSDLKILIA